MPESKAFVYTIQTLSGKEHLISQYIDKLFGTDLIIDKYIPMREVPRKVNGIWEKRTERLFPGYLFIETLDPEGLFFQLKKIPHLSKILADSENTFYLLSDNEVCYIRRVGSLRGDHVFGISQVAIDDTDQNLQLGERVRVISGDLLNFQGDIVRFDLHHRKVYIRADLFGGTEISVGLELIDKV